jgi:hypothetical protein
MRRIPLLTLILLAVVVAVGIGKLALAACPDCYNNFQNNLDGPGSNETPSRRTISVQIDATWGSPTNSRVWNSTCAGTASTGCATSGTSAVSMWNNQTDQSGNKTGYFLDVQ